MIKAGLIAFFFSLCLIISAQNPDDDPLLITLDSLINSGSDTATISFQNKILNQAESRNDPSLLAKVLQRLAGYQLINNRYNLADKTIKKLTNLSLSSGDSSSLSEAYLLRGRWHFNQDDPNVALDFYYNSIDVSPKTTDSHYVTYGYIARILQNNRDSENAIKYHKLALEGSESNEDWNSYTRTCINLCILFNGKATLNLDSSAHYGLRALEVAEQNNLDYMAAVAKNIVTAPLIRLGEHEKGLRFSKESMQLAEQYRMPARSEYIQYINQAYAYLGLGHLDSARIVGGIAREMWSESIENWRLDYNIHKESGDFQKALIAMETYHEKSDSVTEANTRMKFSENQSRLEANQKEKEVALLEQQARVTELEINQQRFMLIGLGALIVLIIAFGVLYVRQQRLKKEQQFSEMEQRLLRSQMNPHFIFNSMTAIQHYMITKGAEEASHYMGTFSQLMRQILDHSRAEFISLGEEIDTLKNYMELQKMRFNDQFTYKIEVDEELDEDYHFLPPMFAQPFIENALEHGLFKKEGSENHIQIVFNADANDQIKLQITDTGTGMVLEESKGQHKSLATQITKERLTIFQKSLNSKSELHIENIPGEGGKVEGLLVSLALPSKVMVPA